MKELCELKKQKNKLIEQKKQSLKNAFKNFYSREEFFNVRD